MGNDMKKSVILDYRTGFLMFSFNEDSFNRQTLQYISYTFCYVAQCLGLLQQRNFGHKHVFYLPKSLDRSSISLLRRQLFFLMEKLYCRLIFVQYALHCIDKSCFLINTSTHRFSFLISRKEPGMVLSITFKFSISSVDQVVSPFFHFYSAPISLILLFSFRL